MTKIVHHPNAESLMSCSAGSMPEAFAAVMASHLAMCPDCHDDLALMEEIGKTLLGNITAVALDCDPPLMAWRRAESETVAPGSNTGSNRPASIKMGDIPSPLAAVTGHYLDDIPWKRLSPGVLHHAIGLSRHAQGILSLFKVAPGVALPDHSHGGSELTLVLRGAYTDKTGRYAAGDVADIGTDVEHRPVADAIEGCVCLIASDQKMRFKSVLARLVQPLTGL